MKIVTVDKTVAVMLRTPVVDMQLNERAQVSVRIRGNMGGFVHIGGKQVSLSVLRKIEIHASGKYLFINAFAADLRAEILDPSGQVLADCSAEDSLEFAGDSCCARLRWKRRETLPSGDFKIRFLLTNGDLYSFWTTDHPDGRSGGFLAAGSCDYPSGRDL